ncbi:unnamed protein product [Onchocerca ochengi]|uniref:ATP-dependent DNA helicase n=1 Tax=Onchocerca ochengi TaxID=42157 RepID=A0A182DWZ0_ONCOC|nr:unnamed protein product [Onchocerca ochengi]
MGKVLQKCKLIVWDECTMAHKKSMEALDRSLQDLRRISLPHNFCNLVTSKEELVEKVFPNIQINYKNHDWLSVRAILAAKNKDVDELDNIIQSNIQSEMVTYRSIDTVVEADEAVNYPTEFMNSSDLPGMPSSLSFGGISSTLPEFKYLLRNTQFLLKLVEMVDSDVYYTLEDKCALSSLVIGSLLDDMRHCTEVVFAILNHHILLSLKKCEPHIIFRQSGSLAEQIFTIWFTLCFMEYLKDGPGQSMYLLYKALKYQIERGPVDAITGDARYSLNEAKLLRRPLNVTSMTSTHPVQYYHLEQPLSTENCTGKENHIANTSMPEIFLTRLLTSKRIVQKFLDGFMESIIYANGKECPSLLLFVFHTFDEIATRNNFTNETAVRSWKVNIWILRFWVNILTNIDYVLDVERIPAVDSSLAVIAQTLVDAFSNANYKFEKESPSSKLLFAKDIKRYRIQVTNFFRIVAASPRLSIEAFHSYFATLTENPMHCALQNDLCEWVRSNGISLLKQLSTDQCAETRGIMECLKYLLSHNETDMNRICSAIQFE